MTRSQDHLTELFVTSEVSCGHERVEGILLGAGPHSEVSLSAAPQRRH